MGDPQGLYIVSAIVVAGLVAWVATVLIRSERLPPRPPRSEEEPTADARERARSGARGEATDANAGNDYRRGDVPSNE